MLVCPACRNENPEVAQFCIRCGRSLEPAAGVVQTLERRGQEAAAEDFDLPPPKRSNPAMGILGLGTAVLVITAGAVWWALRPDPCEGKFVSDQFPYCVSVPAGWDEGTEQFGEQTADTYSTPTQDAVVLVVAEGVDAGTDTSAYAESHRSRQEAASLFPGRVRTVRIGGQDAVAWEWSRPIDDGTVFRQRQVALVRGGTGWLITFTGDEEVFDRQQVRFERLLDSWSFT